MLRERSQRQQTTGRKMKTEKEKNTVKEWLYIFVWGFCKEYAKNKARYKIVWTSHTTGEREGKNTIVPSLVFSIQNRKKKKKTPE